MILIRATNKITGETYQAKEEQLDGTLVLLDNTTISPELLTFYEVERFYIH